MGGVIKPVVWTTRSKKDLDKVMRFNTELYGLEKAREIAFNIRQRVQILESPDVDFTKTGAIDTDFLHLKRKYRKLIGRHYKITYREGKTRIYIARIFDTRQHPNKNK